MIKLAFVGSKYRAQVESATNPLDGVEVVAYADSISGLAGHSPQAIVCDLRDLGTSPVSTLQALVNRPGLELVVVTYSFAPRKTVDSLRLGARVRVVQGPLSLANLRAQLVHLIVRDILDQDERDTAPPAPTRCPHCQGVLAL